MNTRGLLVVVRDVLLLALGTAGIVHEEFYTTAERPVLIMFYGACLGLLALAKGIQLKRILSKLAETAGEDEEEEPEPSGSITGPGTSGRPRSRQPRSHRSQ